MQIKIGAPVITLDGEQVGVLDRVVIEPGTNEITHLVVEKGFLFTTDKVIPMEMVGASTENKVSLRVKATDLEQIPDFLDLEYVPARKTRETLVAAPTIADKEKIRALYLYPRAGTFGPFTTYSATHFARQAKNIPEDTIALEENAKVLTEDKDHVGNVERILTAPQSDRATHIVIAKGILLKERKIVPTCWIKTVLTDKIHLSVDAELVDNLPTYRN